MISDEEALRRANAMHPDSKRISDEEAWARAQSVAFAASSRTDIKRLENLSAKFGKKLNIKRGKQCD